MRKEEVRETVGEENTDSSLKRRDPKLKNIKAGFSKGKCVSQMSTAQLDLAITPVRLEICESGALQWFREQARYCLQIEL